MEKRGKNTLMTEMLFWNRVASIAKKIGKRLEQGRTLELEDVSYGIAENGDILHMYSEDSGVPLPSLSRIWNLIEKLDDSRIFIMSGEVALTKMNRERAEKRVKN